MPKKPITYEQMKVTFNCKKTISAVHETVTKSRNNRTSTVIKKYAKNFRVLLQENAQTGPVSNFIHF
jgi:hypothetical protein